MKKIEPERLYSINEIRDEVFEGRMTSEAILKMVHRGELPAVRFGRRRVFARGADLTKIITQLGAHVEDVDGTA